MEFLAAIATVSALGASNVSNTEKLNTLNDVLPSLVLERESLQQKKEAHLLTLLRPIQPVGQAGVNFLNF